MRLRQFYKHKFARSSLWLVLLTSILLGIFIAQYFKKPVMFGSWAWVMIFSGSAGLLIWRRRTYAFALLIIIGLGLGLWRGGQVAKALSIYDNLYGHMISVEGVVADDPAYIKDYNGKTQYEFHIDHVVMAGRKLPDNLRIRTNRGITLKRGFKVKVTGNLNRTLSKAQAGAISFGNIELISTNQSFVEKIRQRFITGVYSSLPEPAASLGLGYLIGIRSSIPASLTLALTITGLTHIVAVSGYNLTIIIRAVRRIFGKLSRYQNIILSFVLLALFVLCTGNNPSIARATVISVLSLLGWYYGREFRPMLLILWGAVITAWISPSYIWGNVGWYLSFLAFIGILLVAPVIRQVFYKNKKPKLFGGIVLETLCAQIMTLPYIIAIFGTVSLVALPANVLVLPLIPLAMLFTLVAGIAGAILPAYAGWLAWPAHYILSIQIWIVETMSRISWAQIKLHLFTYDALFIYIVITIMLIIYRHKHPKPLAITSVVV